jgi:hypothetical protein
MTKEWSLLWDELYMYAVFNKSVWRKRLTRHPLKVKTAGSNPATDTPGAAGVRVGRDYRRVAHEADHFVARSQCRGRNR